MALDSFWTGVLVLLGGTILGLAILALTWSGPALDPKVRPFRRPDRVSAPDVEECDVQWLYGHLARLHRDEATGDVVAHEPLHIARDRLYWTLEFPSVANRSIGKFRTYRHPGIFASRVTINQVPTRVVELRDAVVEATPDALDPHVFEQDITTAWLRQGQRRSTHRIERDGWTLREWDSDAPPRAHHASDAS